MTFWQQMNILQLKLGSLSDVRVLCWRRRNGTNAKEFRKWSGLSPGQTTRQVKQQLDTVAKWYAQAGRKDLQRLVLALERDVTESVTIIASCKAMQCFRPLWLSRSFEGRARNFCWCKKLSHVAAKWCVTGPAS